MNPISTLDDVFINCPFDTEFQPLFRAMTFAVFACGFRLRSALEIDDGSYARLEQIMDIVSECRFGIHDLSRTEIDAVNGLPRFNMPLELGIFLGAKRFGSMDQKKKRALVLDLEKYRYQKFISDINGMDIRAHQGEPLSVITIIQDWLVNVSRRRGIPGGPVIQNAHNRFIEDLPVQAATAGFAIDEIPYVDFEFMVTDWLLSDGLAR